MKENNTMKDFRKQVIVREYYLINIKKYYIYVYLKQYMHRKEKNYSI